MEEVTDSGLFARAPTLTVQLLADGSMLQVYPNAVRHVRAGGRSAEWKPPGKKVIEKASANARQVTHLGGGRRGALGTSEISELLGISKAYVM